MLMELDSRYEYTESSLQRMRRILHMRLRVEIDKDGTSPNPQVAIWRGQHQCVSEDFVHDEPAPTSERCGEIIIKHQLDGDRGHFSVLNQAFIKLNCGGFPHSVIAQITRHQNSNFLVQSNRYTGKRFVQVAMGERMVDEVFYFRDLGRYVDRNGSRYEYTEEMRRQDIEDCATACEKYADRVLGGMSEEHARDCIPYNFRQHFTISGTLEAMWHWLDQRSKKDAQHEIQILAQMAMGCLDIWTPELSAWYRANRWGKARLAP